VRFLAVALAVALVNGCDTTYLVTRRSADAVAALDEAERARTAVPVTADGDRRAYVRASRLGLTPSAPAPPGAVRAHATWAARYPRLLIAGAVIVGLGVILVGAGAGVAVSPTHCSAGEEFCGFGQAIEAVTIMGLGGATGLVGIVLTAVGATSSSPEVPPGEPALRYLPP